MTYSQRNICAFRGSSVNISCFYEGWNKYTYVSWSRSDRGQVYADYGHIQIVRVEKGSILRIKDLKGSDSAEYHCRWRHQQYQRRVLGTTLEVKGREEPRQMLLHLSFQEMLHLLVLSPCPQTRIYRSRCSRLPPVQSCFATAVVSRTVSPSSGTGTSGRFRRKGLRPTHRSGLRALTPAGSCSTAHTQFVSSSPNHGWASAGTATCDLLLLQMLPPRPR